MRIDYTLNTIDRLQIDKYSVAQLLGKGGCAEVYLAEDKRLGRPVALKKLMLPQALSSSERTVLTERFYQEARTTANLHHPNILRIIDAFEAGAEHFIVMEYVNGCTLKNKVGQEKLSLQELMDIFILIAGAFAYAHDHGVIHRDIKPENIMINAENIPIIMDFGTAKKTDDLSSTVDGSLLGTLAYMSPEQLHNSKNADAQSDIYSFGATMYEVFTGHLPFEADSIAQLIGKIFSEPLVLAHEKCNRVPPALSAVIAQALCREPQDRFTSMHALKHSLLQAKQLMEESVLGAPSAPSSSERWEIIKGFQLMGILDDQIAKKLTGSLHIKTVDQRGCIHFDKGQIQAVSTDSKSALSPIDTLYEMAMWESGSWAIKPCQCGAVQEDFAFIPSDILLAEIENCQSHYQSILEELREYLDQPIQAHIHQLSQTGLHQPRLKMILSALDNEITLRKMLKELPLDRLSILSGIKELYEKKIIRFND
jgi:eukaryotic-like serine/threonine-protein kinase